MTTYEYIGTFKSPFSPSEYSLTVRCNGFLQAYFLLTAEAINTGRHWQLDTIESETEKVKVAEIKPSKIFRGRKEQSLKRNQS